MSPTTSEQPSVARPSISISDVVERGTVLSHAVEHAPGGVSDSGSIASTWTVSTAPGDDRVVLRFPAGPVFLVDTADGRAVLPLTPTGVAHATASDAAWALPADPDVAGITGVPSWHVVGGPVEVTTTPSGVEVVAHAERIVLTAHRSRPHADVDGGAFLLDVPGGDVLGDAWAGFYWDTILPCVVERTTAASYPDASGYVISTLADKYVGTYPDVDHEFQIKGRLAWGSRTDLAVVRRMIALQLRMMREDPEQFWRDPCAVQPDGSREYHVRRSSVDGSANAVMFLVTGNVEVVESVWNVVARTGDTVWLAEVIDDLEGAMSLVESCVDARGRLWSDVYYEDQVIKDGRETMAAVLAAESCRLLADLELLLEDPDQTRGVTRSARAAHWRYLAARLDAGVRRPLPLGHWDGQAGRFVDWVDRSGRPHDHVHLLANVLPVLFGVSDDGQTRAVLDLVDTEYAEFQRFPTFLAARVQDYTDDEIGDGGPYDLCAAGRYWCWDAAFWSWRRNGTVLRDQLLRVAEEGAHEDWIMGERYDMGHVYYADGSNWHGAAHYYEYPNVFAWVLVSEYLGVRPSLTADLRIAPRIVGTGTVVLGQHAHRLTMRLDGETFSLTNDADTTRTFELDLAAVSGAAPGTEDTGGGTGGGTGPGHLETVTLTPGETVSRSRTTTTTGSPA